MAASEIKPRSSSPQSDSVRCLSAAELDERLAEEIGRAERYGSHLSCLLIVFDNLDEMAREHGGELREQMLTYVAQALPHELRRFDRVGRPSDRELLIVLPGADGPRGEIVARRVLDRLRTIKIEVDGSREPLRVSVGLAPWRDKTTVAEILARSRAAAHAGSGLGNGQGEGGGHEESGAEEGDGASEEQGNQHLGAPGQRRQTLTTQPSPASWQTAPGTQPTPHRPARS